MDHDKTSVDSYNHYIEIIYMITHILNNYSSIECGKNLSLYIYLTDFKKNIPNSNLEEFDTEHVNTAYSDICTTNSQIVIYRKEEWTKVLIHEAIHFLNIDFSCVNDNAHEQLDQQFYRIIPLKKENIRLYEAYCEFWALQIHCSIVAFFDNMKRDIDYEKTFAKYENLLKNETKYSLFQMNKILNYSNIDYYDIVFYSNNYINKSVYNENTYAISYFIVKTILLFHQNEFIEWCLQNNSKRNPMMFVRTFDNMKSFFSFIQRFYRNEKFLDALEYSDYDVDRRSFFYNTTTMSLHEMY